MVYQELTRITKSITDGDFFENPALKAAMDNCVKHGSALHLMGLLSDGGVHSHNSHLYALLEMAKKWGLKNVYVHCFLDGRDVPPSSGVDFVAELEAKMKEIGVGKIATLMGRYYAMDRDNRWERVEQAYNAMALREGRQAEDAVAAVRASYADDVTDEWLKQLRIAETEKYAHVTFFFNGGVEAVSEGEDRSLIPSPKVATYDLQPEMSAPEVTADVVERIESGKYDAIILNFANCDMVGHTGVFEAAVKAVETVDSCLGKVLDAVSKAGGVSLVTADHGNADQMTEPDGSPFTAHTTNPVPFIVVGEDVKLREGGRLCDIAPTMLELMGLPKPEEMDGVSLIAK